MPVSIEARLRDIVVSQLGVDEDEVKSSSDFVGDLGADSLDVVELVMTVEEEFSVELQDGEVERIKTFGDALTLVSSRAT